MISQVSKVVAVIAVLAVATACSSSSKSGSTGSSSSAPASGGSSTATATGAAATGDPIKIGMINPENASFFNAPDELAAVKAAFATINANGGVKGRPLKLDWCNESNDANKAAACARTVVSNGDVATIASISPFGGPAVAQTLTAAGIAGVAYNVLAQAEFASPVLFPYDGLAAWESAGAVGAAIMNEGVKKVVLVETDSTSAAAIDALFQKAVAGTGGTAAKDVMLPQRPVADYSSYAQQIISSGAELAVIPLAKAQAIGIINAVRQLGSNIKLAVPDTFSDSDLKQLGANADGIYIFSPTPWVHDAADFPGINNFLASMKDEVARGDADANVAKARPFALRDWLAAFALRDVLTGILAHGGQITAATVLAAFKAATNLATQNVVAQPWSPAKIQTAVSGYPNLSNTLGYLLVVKDDQQVLTSKDPIDVLDYLK